MRGKKQELGINLDPSSGDPTGLNTGYEGPSPIQGEGRSPIFLGDNQGPVVMVWDCLFPGEQENTLEKRL
jgi:hypothetical protein